MNPFSKKLLSVALCSVIACGSVVFVPFSASGAELNSQSAGDTGILISGDYEYRTMESMLPSVDADTGRIVVVKETVAMITSYNGGDENIIVPEALDGYKVKYIGSQAFLVDSNQDFVNSKTITLPKTLVGFAYDSIDRNSNIEAVYVDEENEYYTSVDGVLYSGFGSESKLSTLYFYPPKKVDESFAVADECYSITESAFENNPYITSVVLNDEITEIPNNAFCDCSSLAQLTVPSELVSVGDYAFAGTSITTLSLPETMESIGNFAFSNSKLKSITTQGTVTNLGEGAFESTPYESSLTDTVVYFDKVLYKNNNASGVVVVKDGTQSISPSAFSGNYSITEVRLPSTVESIGDYAFSNCTSLKKLYASESVEIIGDEVFSDCENLVIVAPSDSEIALYAEDNGITVVEPYAVLIGDVNLDGIISIADATVIQKYLVNLTDLNDEQLEAADTNADGYVDIKDATMIQKYLVNLIDMLG